MIIVPYAAAHFAGVDRLWQTVFPDDPPRNRAAVAIPAKLAQGDGIGSALVKEALARMAVLGCGKVNRLIREGNEAVAAFYQALGFAIEPRTSMGRMIREPDPKR